jgi:flagellar assembly factor FliW
MLIETTRFGEIDVAEKSIMHMPQGMLGFESCKRFVLLEDRPDTPFKWLQAIDDPKLAFVVIDPTEFFSDYEFELTDEDADSLDLKDSTDAAIVTTVTIDGENDKVTTNLVGPVVINSRTLTAKQIVLQDERYGTKHVIGRKTQANTTFEAAIAA